jgi:hypothetical protein
LILSAISTLSWAIIKAAMIYKPIAPNLRAAPPSLASCRSNAHTLCWVVLFNDTVDRKSYVTMNACLFAIQVFWNVTPWLCVSSFWRRPSKDRAVFSSPSMWNEQRSSKGQESIRVTSLKNWNNQSTSIHNRSAWMSCNPTVLMLQRRENNVVNVGYWKFSNVSPLSGLKLGSSLRSLGTRSCAMHTYIDVALCHSWPLCKIQSECLSFWGVQRRP